MSRAREQEEERILAGCFPTYIPHRLRSPSRPVKVLDYEEVYEKARLKYLKLLADQPPQSISTNTIK